MTDQQSAFAACFTAIAIFILWRIWGCVEDIAHSLADQSRRLDQIEREQRRAEDDEGEEWTRG